MLLAAAALMVLVPPQMVTEARAASNNSLPVLGRAPSFVFNGHTASDLAIGLHKHACTRRPMPEPNGATVSFESLAAPARAPISKAKDVACTAYVTVDVSSSTPKPRVIAPLGSSADLVLIFGQKTSEYFINLPKSAVLFLRGASTRAHARVCRIEMPGAHFLLHLGLALSPPSLLLQTGLASSHAPPLVAQSAHTHEKHKHALAHKHAHT